MSNLRLAVFASGSGSNFQAILDSVSRDELSLCVALCVSNSPKARVLERARQHGVPTLVMDPRDFAEETAYTDALLNKLRGYDVNFIALAGYLRKIPSVIVSAFENRMLNIHPALLPRFGGKGFYGQRVHEAVLRSEETTSGATVHIVSEEYDTGPIVLQQQVPVMPGDTPETLAARVLKTEHLLYPKALRLFANNLIDIQGQTVRIKNTSPLPSKDDSRQASSSPTRQDPHPTRPAFRL